MHVSQLYIYPVKSFAGIAMTRASVVRRGFEYDRRWMVVDASGRFVTQREVPSMASVRTSVEQGCIVLDAPEAPTLRLPATLDAGPRVTVEVWRHSGDAIAYEPAEAWLTRVLGFPARIVYMPDDVERPVSPKHARDGDVVSFADGYPFLLIGQASLDDLNARLATPVTMSRFRPNIVVAGAEPFAEDDWPLVRMGALTFRGVKPCDRCTIVTIDPMAPKAGGLEPLRTLATYRARDHKVLFGMNLVHDGTGELSVGDTVSTATV